VRPAARLKVRHAKPITAVIVAAGKLAEIAMGCLVAAWPSLIVTKSVSASERCLILDVLMSRQRALWPSANREKALPEMLRL
jgi:hypothetical protein